MPTASPVLSILIVNWNTRQLVLDCLRSIDEAAIGLPCETIVVDNASSDGSAGAIAEAFPGVELIRNDRNLGFAVANNQAYGASHGRYVLLLNSDTLVTHGQLEPLVAFLEAHAEVGIVGPKLLNADGSFQLSATPFVEPWDVFYEFARFPRLWQPRGHRQPRRLYEFDGLPRPVDMVIGAALLIRRTTIEAIGLLDEAYFMYGEEQDWCYRARAAGWQTYFVPAAAVTHLGGQSAAQVPYAMLSHRFASTFRFLGKHQGSGAARLARVLLLWAAAQNAGLVLARFLARREPLESFRRDWQGNWVVWRTALVGRPPARRG